MTREQNIVDMVQCAACHTYIPTTEDLCSECQKSVGVDLTLVDIITAIERLSHTPPQYLLDKKPIIEKMIQTLTNLLK